MNPNNPEKGKHMWRRFQLKDKEKEQALMELIQQKGLSHKDLGLILEALELSSDGQA